MLALAFLHWWYGPGWLRLLQGIGSTGRKVYRNLSVAILLRTLFAPWRRIITYGNHSFIEGMKALLDNAVSRAVGFGVRLLVLLTAAIALLLLAAGGFILLLLWPFLPLMAIGLIGWGIMP